MLPCDRVALEEIVSSKRPLSGITIVEFAGIGPAPFAAMILAGLGADVIRIDKPRSLDSKDVTDLFTSDAMNRDRRSIALDLKSEAGLKVAKKLIARADGLIEGFRPGVMERLGLGPDEAHQLNGGLTYVRMTGWGQNGPLAETAGHDLNYIGITGLLDAIGTSEAPVIPLNLVGDFGGGGTIAAIGMLAGILSARISGEGSVVDAAIVDGVSLMGTMFEGLLSRGLWSLERSKNLLDGGAPFYSIYNCADEKAVAVAALEPKFFTEMATRLGLNELPAFSNQYGRETWPEMRRVLSATFSKQNRAYFEKLFEGSDACVTPVNNLAEAKLSRHLFERNMFQELQGVSHPRPAPRFGGAVEDVSPSPTPGENRDEILLECGFSAPDISRLERAGAFG